MVKIRLMRMGAKKQPYFRVVVADARSPRDGRFIENIGKYHPKNHPSLIDIDEERAIHWLKEGAQPTEPVKNLLVKTGIWDKFEGGPGTPVPPPPDAEPAPAKAPEAAEEETEATSEDASAEASEEEAQTAEAAAGEEKLPAGEAEQPDEPEEEPQPEGEEQ